MGIPRVVEPARDTDIADIVEGCRRGDTEAQQQVFERYRDRVFAIAHRFLKGDEEAARDVTQEVFVKLFRSVATFRRDARFSTWLYRIVANTCMDELRRRRRLVFFGDLPDVLHPATSSEGPSVVGADVAAAVARLSPPLRMAVLLRYFEDLSYEEIAQALDSTTGTIASRLHRAHAILARELASHAPRDRGVEGSTP
jgi:RNA polymerase sigma-70 factor (ECF subfamily)